MMSRLGRSRACLRLPDGTAVYRVGEHAPAMRLDLFLKSRIPKLSRRRVQRAILERVTLAGGRKSKPASLVRPGDLVTVRPAAPPLEEEPEVDVPILYEDDDLIVVNKPAGLLVHPSCHVRKGTVLHVLARSVPGPLHLVHRLDRETSGAMIIARSSRAARLLSEQIARSAIRSSKRYLALVYGTVRDGGGVIDLPIGRALRSAVYVKQGINAEGGRPSHTEFRVLARGGGFSLIEASLRTGRRHQIRVHLAALGHAVVGDKLYGPSETHYLRFIRSGFDERMRRELQASRQLLHAWRLSLCHPRDGRPLHFKAPMAADMRWFVGKLLASAVAGPADVSPARPRVLAAREVLCRSRSPVRRPPPRERHS